MLSTDKQTNRQTDIQTNQRYQKHNLLCQGGKNWNEWEKKKKKTAEKKKQKKGARVHIFSV